MRDLLEAEFAAAMGRFGPFPAKPRLTVGVSGGADSTALALLAHDWATARHGTVQALIIDHDLRTASGREANLTRQRLEACGIPARVVTLTGLAAGPNLQDKARRARHAALATATREAGAIFLLLGHHAADQSETVAMRARHGDGGLEGMADWTARNDVVLLRPLLSIRPAQLREFLMLRTMKWVEDPSNLDQRFERVRVRLAGSDILPRPPALRQQAETMQAGFLARHATIRPEGFAVLYVDSVPAAALAALIRMVGGSQYAPHQRSVAQLAGALRPATLGGVRLLPAGKFGPGWLLVREPAACSGAIAARKGSVWDNRFRLLDDVDGGTCSAVGADAPMFRNVSNLPAAVLRVLPCLRRPGGASAKPMLAKAFFTPSVPAAALPFGAPQPAPTGF